MFYSEMTKRKWRRIRGKIIAKHARTFGPKFPNQMRKIPHRFGFIFDDLADAFLYKGIKTMHAEERQKFEFGE